MNQLAITYWIDPRTGHNFVTEHVVFDGDARYPALTVLHAFFTTMEMKKAWRIETNCTSQSIKARPPEPWEMEEVNRENYHRRQ